jgi:hypothetical protein
MRVKGTRFLLLSVVIAVTPVAEARADEVGDWNRIMYQAAVAANTNPVVMTRNAAIVQAAVFDALNGIERRFAPVHVVPAAPRGASGRAAVVQAAYETLITLYPAQQPSILDPAYAASLAGIASGSAAEHSTSIADGIAWGKKVAEVIVEWRSLDGFNLDPPIFDGGPPPVPNGRWRPTPPAFAKGFGFPQFSSQVPWVMDAPWSFRPAPPRGAGTPESRADFAETRDMTNYTIAHPFDDRTILSHFWNAGTASAYWHNVTLALAAQKHLTMSETSRMLGLVSLAMADAAIGCWDAKYLYAFWRPITAITVADDGDPVTVQQADWRTLFPTPAHPDYPSGHSCVSGAAGRVLSGYFGEETAFSIESNTVPGQFRHFTSFTQALEDVKNARIFSGIHFRTACEIGQELGIAVADHVIENALRPIHGNKTGQPSK